MTVIGITGPTGAGKTTALREVERLGGFVIDADAVYHRLLEENAGLRQALTDRFGPKILDSRGKIDRKALGKVVFGDPAALAGLNEITHDFLETEIRRLLAQAEGEGRSLAAIDAIRLIESGAARLCRVTLAVTAPAEARVARIMAREGISAEYARARVAAQQPDSFYQERCGHVLVNDCPTGEEFALRVRELLREVLGEK